MPLTLALTFVSGIAAILAPCIWPLLPIVLSSANSQTKSKGIGTVIGIVVSFTIFTLLISFLISTIALNTETLRKISALILFVLGLTFVIPILSVKVEALLSLASSKLPLRTQNQNTEFFGGLITGLVLGTVWSPCAGPILAIVAAISATQAISAAQVANILAFAAGLAIPLLTLTVFGSFLFTRTRFLSSKTRLIQQIFGILIVITAIMIFLNWDRTLQKILLDAFPAFNTFLANIENLN